MGLDKSLQAMACGDEKLCQILLPVERLARCAQLLQCLRDLPGYAGVRERTYVKWSLSPQESPRYSAQTYFRHAQHDALQFGYQRLEKEPAFYHSKGS